MAAYEGMRQIYKDRKERRMSATELTARGRLIRAQYIRDKREEILMERNVELQTRYVADGERLTAALCKGEITEPEKVVDALCDLIGALRAETVTANVIREKVKAVLLGGQPEQKAKPKPIPQKKSTPTLEEVAAYMRAYCDKKGVRFSAEEAEKCFDQYEANGWKQSNGNRITDWKAAVRNWVRRIPEFQRAQQKQSVFSSDASYDLEDFTKRAIGLRDIDKKDKEATA